MKPIRIQRKRSRGWKMPDNTVYVGRPSKWGNEFIVGKRHEFFGIIITKNEAMRLFSYKIERYIKNGMINIKELEGKNLACWCKIGELCHADVLLKLANP